MKAWRTALRIAFREGRAARGKFLFVILAVAAGVACITGVRGFSEAFRGMLLREARTLMAADLTVRTFEPPSPAQEAVMADLARRGVVRTRIVETVSMVSTPGGGDPLLVSVKAVDPAFYPFYGQVRLSSADSLGHALTPETVAASEDLLLRLGVQPGGAVHLGEQDYRVAAAVTLEPDRMTGTLNVGPRLMLSHAAFDRSGLLAPGSRASHRQLFRLPAGGPSVAEVRDILKRAFPEAMIADFRETHPLITRGLNRSTVFLSLVSLVSLIVGALGVATAMQSHLRQRMDSIAVMKCLGARSSQIIRIYVLQTLGLGLAGSVLGVLLGLAVQSVFPFLLARYFPVRAGLSLDAMAVVHGLGAGVLTTLLFTWPPLAAIRRVRPTLILRRDMPDARPSWRERWRNYRRAAAGSLAILAGLGLLAASVAGGGAGHSARIGAWFAGGLLAGLVVLAGAGHLLLDLLRLVMARLPWKPPPSVRHGIANLYRPGSQAPFVLAALGVGVMFTLTIFLVQHSMLAQIFRSAPPGMPNVFLVNITPRERDGLLELLKRQPGVESPPEIVASVPARLEAINGVRIEQLPIRRFGRRFLRTRSVTWAASPPPHTEIVSGAWWRPEPGASPAQVSVAEDAAGILGVKPGARLEFTSAGRNIPATVASIHRTESVRPGSGIEFIFTPGALEGLPAIYFGGMRVRAKDVPALQRAAYRRYPTVTVINAADVLEIIQEVVDQIAVVVRFVSFFALFAGAVVLASSVAGTRFRRIREVAVLKALGATPRRVAAIFSIEFLLLGSLAGLMGSLLAALFSGLLLDRFFDAGFRFDPLLTLLAIALSALLATGAGWLAGYRLLAQKPLAVLRQE